MFQFELRHVPGKTFRPDGLSHQEKQDGDEEYPEDKDMGRINTVPVMMMEKDVETPLELEEFREEIDN